MDSTNALDLTALLAPIAGSQPAGVNTPFGVKDQLEQMRKEVDPADFAADDPLKPTEFRKADWSGIIQLGIKTLLQTSKDLQVAARLVEAQTKVFGFKGLADGLELLDGLVDQAWERLVPVIDDPSDLDIRSAPFEWLDDADRGARFPSTVGGVLLLDPAKDFPGMGLLQWKQGQSGQGAAGLDKALAGTSVEKLQERSDQVARAREILGRLDNRLVEKLKDLAPSMGQLRTMLDQCQTILGQMLSRKSPGRAASPTSQAPTVDPASGKPQEQEAVGSRDQAYQMMAKAAEMLSAIEPHSPVPYLVRRAVELGKLPFPELIQAFVREQGTLDVMFRELGITIKPQN